jgi:hypothetical protein
MARIDIVKCWALPLGCWAALGSIASFAAAPATPPWIALASPAPGTSTVEVLDSGRKGISVRVTIAGFLTGTHDSSSDRYTTLTLPGGGALTDIGKPTLPVIRRLIVVPDNAVASCSFSGSPLTTSLSALGLAAQVMPVQPPIPKIPGAVDAAVFVQDSTVYSSPQTYPATPVTLSEAGILFGRRLISLEVCPVALTPSTGAVTFYSNLVVTVTFTNQLIQATAMPLTAREQALLAGTVLNPSAPGDTVTSTQKRLLILAPNTLTNGLNPFIAYKTGRGWAVDCFTTNRTGKTSASIQTFIKTRYTNSVTRPDALLLVGDISQIPRFVGSTMDYPDTDLYYGCMDGSSDWQPEFPVGRFSVTTTNQLNAVLNKSMAHEQSRLEPWIKRATFMASSDNYAVSEGTHNAVITGSLAQVGYSADKLYCYSSNATPTHTRSAINKGCAFGIYSGHGDTTYWADGPAFTQSDVNSLTNSGHYPIICSFACLTGKYSFPECFAETWLRAASKGAAAILASSVTSYWDEDDILEKCLIQALFNENQPQLGTAIWRAKQLYLAKYGISTETTRRYFEQYNLLGDPTLEVIGLPVLTNGIPVAWFTSQGITNTNYALELQEDRDGDGMTAQQEYLAGTNPGAPDSSLRLTSGECSGGSLRLSWLSANTLINPMPAYQIWSRTNLTTGSWSLQTNILIRTPPTNAVQLSIPPNMPQLFYRITITN